MSQTEFLKFLHLLKTKESMVAGRNLSANELRFYLDGLLMGVGISGYAISLWLRKKLNIEINVGWSDYIWDENKTLPDAELKRMLIQTVEDFLNENSEK